ncbi:MULTISPECIES: helix-turn-helix domain-containing protein [unclassified Streptomyces]|uniref:AlbA family DNA-binding domain-containing protein n=1 Tax=unclassified Streptomyces TaxID=2593676 RepID=UPI0004BD1F25|nr:MULTISPECIES: ATP-binding protein [unclassified Streptomyces]
MASSWTRIHQELNLSPSPLTFGMIERAAKEIDGERDDLDWKRILPKKPEAGLWSEFAKDVAAMANARGGLLVYGVRNDRVIEGVDPRDAPTEHLYKWLRAHTQPFVGGVDIFPLQCPDTTKSVLVVDVPASAMAPHFVLGTSSRDKEQQAFAVPARFTDHTTWLSEHEVERAYRDRFARQEDAGKALERHVTETSEAVLGEGDNTAAWLIVVSRPSRPLPLLVPDLQRHEASAVMNAALSTAARLRGDFGGSSPMRDALTGGPRVGLRRWVDGNFLTPAGGPHLGRLAMVELHHDGTVVYAVDVSRLARRQKVDVGPKVPVEVQVVQSGVCDAIALSQEVARAQHLSSSSDLVGTIVCDKDPHKPDLTGRFPGFAAVLEQHRGFLDVPKDYRCPVTIRQVQYELAPLAGTVDLQAAAQSLASGLINQFGVASHLT